MPKEFEEAVRKGAKVRTKKLPGGKYIHIAVLSKGKSIGGEVHKKKGNPSMPKKKKKESWVGKLKKKVRKHFDKKKKEEEAFKAALKKVKDKKAATSKKKKEKKKSPESSRTKQTKEQLRKAGLSEADIKKLQGKK